MLPDVDTRDPDAISAAVHELAREGYEEANFEFIDAVFDFVRELFEGRYPGFAKVDISYHDYQHTLQATLCMARLMAGYRKAGGQPEISWRKYELGLASVLLHDSGYLKTLGDGPGSGARFTFTHVLRSCAVAATHLPRFGLLKSEIPIVLGAIRCTGPDSDINRLYFACEEDELLGSFVATADYLGQMAADDYPEELGILYNEFRESDDYANVPPRHRLFTSVEDLIAKTPFFWSDVVLPKLSTDFRGLYRYLAEPYPDGPNRYLESIEKNIGIIKQRATTQSPK
jgi:hypothetical protein